MIPRHLSSRLIESLADTPVVVLVGARQCGKTTLVRSLSREAYPASYLSLDDPATLGAAQADPSAFLADLDGPVILDEVQRAPALFPVLRSAVDRRRLAGRFLLTGSAHVLVMPSLAEALVGRMEALTLWPLSQGEIEGCREGFVDGLFRERLPVWKGPAEARSDFLTRALAGGYPEPINRTGRRRQAWFRSYVATILQREVRELAAVESLHTMPRLLELLAVRAGSLLNFAEISRSAAIPQTTLKRYLALLENTFLVYRLPAWARNPSKRLVKSPKLFLTDAGLLGHLAGWTVEGLSRHPEAAGPLLENFVTVELLKQAGWSRAGCRLFHFRTATGREVDLVLERDDGRVVGIEVKSRTSIVERDFSGLRTLQEICGQSFQRGVVLYTGSQRLSFGPDLYALPVSALWQLGAR